MIKRTKKEESCLLPLVVTIIPIILGAEYLIFKSESIGANIFLAFICILSLGFLIFMAKESENALLAICTFFIILVLLFTQVIDFVYYEGKVLSCDVKLTNYHYTDYSVPEKEKDDGSDLFRFPYPEPPEPENYNVYQLACQDGQNYYVEGEYSLELDGIYDFGNCFTYIYSEEKHQKAVEKYEKRVNKKNEKEQRKNQQEACSKVSKYDKIKEQKCI